MATTRLFDAQRRFASYYLGRASFLNNQIVGPARGVPDALGDWKTEGPQILEAQRWAAKNREVLDVAPLCVGFGVLNQLPPRCLTPHVWRTWCEDAVAASRLLQDAASQANCLHQLGLAYIVSKEREKAINSFLAAIPKTYTAERIGIFASCCYFLASCFVDLERLSEAEEWLVQAEAVASKHKILHVLARVLYQRGKLALKADRRDDAQSALKRSSMVALDAGCLNCHGMALAELARLQDPEGAPTLGIGQFLEALQIAGEAIDGNRVAQLTNELADRVKNLDSVGHLNEVVETAIRRIEAVHDIDGELKLHNESENVVSALGSLARLQRIAEKFDSAEETLQKALQYAQKGGLQLIAKSLRTDMAKAYLSQAELAFAHGLWIYAAIFCEKALPFAVDSSNVTLHRSVTHLMAEAMCNVVDATSSSERPLRGNEDLNRASRTVGEYFARACANLEAGPWPEVGLEGTDALSLSHWMTRVRVALRMGNRQDAAEIVDRLWTHRPGACVSEAEFFQSMGVAFAMLGKFQDAERCYVNAREAFYSSDMDGPVRVTFSLAELAQERGDEIRARILSDEALSLAKQALDPEVRTNAFNNAALIAFKAGAHERAIALIHQTDSFSAELTSGAVAGDGLLALIYFAQGQLHGAFEYQVCHLAGKLRILSFHRFGEVVNFLSKMDLTALQRQQLSDLVNDVKSLRIDTLDSHIHNLMQWEFRSNSS